MSNPALYQPGTVAPSDGESRDPVADALKTIEQTQAALVKVRAQVEDATRLLSEFARISAVFDSVGDRLVNATFKASGEATRGVPSHTVLVAFVEELGDLARLSLGGARDVRRELRARSNNPTPPAAILRDTDAALKELANTLSRISQRPARFVATPNPIEIENRTVPPPPPRVPSALERALAGGVFASTGPKAGGYKN
jgi:ABC-type transporter Mla subunit MlaD